MAQVIQIKNWKSQGSILQEFGRPNDCKTAILFKSQHSPFLHAWYIVLIKSLILDGYSTK